MVAVFLLLCLTIILIGFVYCFYYAVACIIMCGVQLCRGFLRLCRWLVYCLTRLWTLMISPVRKPLMQIVLKEGQALKEEVDVVAAMVVVLLFSLGRAGLG